MPPIQPFNRISPFLKAIDNLATDADWVEVRDDFAASLLGLFLVIRRRPNGQYSWLILKESDDESYANADAAKAALMEELSRFREYPNPKS